MPSLVMDSMDNSLPWSAFAPDGVTPSTELSLVIDTSRPRPFADASSGLISGTANALNHTLRRSFAALNLQNLSDVRLWISSSIVADGSPTRPFFLEVRLGSAALPIGSAGNTWLRYLAVSQTGVWEPLRFSLSDLPPAIQSTVTQMQLRCITANRAFRCNLDDIIAARDQTITDVDAALLAKLNGVFTLNGSPVPAVLHPANGVLAQARPFFEITNYDIEFSRERSDSVRPRGDFSDHGYNLRPAGNAYDLFYQITAVADDRLSQSRMLDFVLSMLPPRGALVVNGCPLPMEAIVVYPFDQIGGVRSGDIPLFFRISTWQTIGSSDPVAPVKAFIVDGDLKLPS